jgi:uncharacterized surface protein with fasciclin (FAS1) repeats
MQRLFVSFIFAALIGSTFAFAEDPKPAQAEKSPEVTKKMAEPRTEKTILDEAHATPEVPQFLHYAVETGLRTMLAPDKQYTLFAPTNSAYENCPPQTKEMLNDQRQAGTLTRFLVVPGQKLSYDDLMQMDGKPLRTMQGTEILVSVKNDTVIVGDALLTGKQWANSNSAMYEINKVLIPLAADPAMREALKMKRMNAMKNEQTMKEQQKAKDAQTLKANDHAKTNAQNKTGVQNKSTTEKSSATK